MTPTSSPAPPRSLDALLAFVKAGGRLLVPTVTRCWVIDAATVARFEQAGAWLLREDGESYRMRQGRGSVYLLPGQLRIVKD